MAIRVFAAIDVGSYELAMKIFEFSQKGGMREIDHIRHRIELGTDTYTTGTISRERVDELCSVLGAFVGIMNSYQADAYKAYGTSAIRETRNASIVLEQVYLRTGLKIEVLSNSEQRFLHYKAVASKGERFSEIIGKGSAIVDIGGGSIQFSLFDRDSLVSTQNIRLGILRMREQLMHLKARTNSYEQLLAELVDNQLAVFHRLYLKDREIENIIIVDDYISNVMHLLGDGSDVITADQFQDFAAAISRKSAENVAADIGIAEENASLLLPSVILLLRILRITKAKRIWAPGVSLSDGIGYEYGEAGGYIRNAHDFENDIIACAQNISKRYHGDKARNELLAKVVTTLFDHTKKTHGCNKRDRLLLRIAALLNDCGRYMSLEAAAECGHSIIMATEIIGLSHTEREIIANIVRFNKVDFNYALPVDRERILETAKLSAIFRVADGICRSHRTKVKEIRITKKEEELIVTADADEDLTMEKGFFGRKAALFEEVFGLRVTLKQKKRKS